MTVSISLVRENTESMRSPRALWVSFPLGRPLGVPGDAPFQRGVIIAALKLLERQAGPLLEDYPLGVPPVDTESAPACPVSFACSKSTSSGWEERLREELSTLMPWYEMGLRRRGGRTLVGVSLNSPEADAGAIGRLLDESALPDDVVWFKRAVEDLKALYLEAMSAQPGEYDHDELRRQLWDQTVLGAALLEFYKHYQASDDPGMQYIARMIAPRLVVGGSTGPKEESDD